MNWLHRMGMRLRALLSKREIDGEMDEELRHLLRVMARG